MPAVFLPLALALSCLCVSVTPQEQQPKSGRDYWERLAREDLERSLRTELNKGTAKNVIIFVGDGMGPNTLTAARIYRAGEDSYLYWETFPHVGLLKTYAENKQVPDSANTATALFTGVKVNLGTLGVDSTVQKNDCNASMAQETHLTSLATLAQAAGKSTGIVTTTRVTHATPGAMYAHSASRYWECDSTLPANSTCKDIGRQLIEDLPGKNFNVILGGGKHSLKKNDTPAEKDPMDSFCIRKDDMDLISDWQKDKESRGASYAVVNDTQTLRSINPSKLDYLLGIFAGSHMTLECERNKKDNGMPSLEEMTVAAIKVLMNNKRGFLLMVESGLIDMAHHKGLAKKAIHEVLTLHDAVNATVNLLEAAGILDDTLILVTSDHSHTLTIGGYPKRGNNILGVAGTAKDKIPYTTLSYANSGKENYHYKVVDNKVSRDDPTSVDTTSFDYHPQASVLMDKNTHGGSDVFIYAKGPHAHLFHHMHEQNYVAEAVKYAAKLGDYANVVHYQYSTITMQYANESLRSKK